MRLNSSEVTMGITLRGVDSSKLGFRTGRVVPDLVLAVTALSHPDMKTVWYLNTDV